MKDLRGFGTPWPAGSSTGLADRDALIRLSARTLLGLLALYLLTDVDSEGAPTRQLATIVLPGGQRIVAALEGRPEPGARVVLRESDGALLATRR